MIQAPRDDRIHVVDLLRLVSILAVFAVHLASSGTARLPHTPWVARSWLYFARNGSYGVTLFFVISGFVITRTITRRTPDLGHLDLRGFYVRRAGRILPLFVLTVALGALVLATGPTGSARMHFCFRDPAARFDKWFWASLPTLCFNWLRIARETTSYGFGVHWDVLWSLAIEEQFYLGYPVLLRALATRRRTAFFLSGVVVLGPLSRSAATALRPRSFLLSYTNSFAAFEQIALGALLCFLLEWLPEAHTSSRRALETAVGLLGATGVVVAYCVTSLESAHDRIWGPSAIALSLCAFLAAGIRGGWFSSPSFSWLTYPGQLSYEGYLLHATVLFSLWPLLEERHVLLAFLAFSGTTLALASLVYRFFEVPLNHAIRRALSAE